MHGEGTIWVGLMVAALLLGRGLRACVLDREFAGFTMVRGQS